MHINFSPVRRDDELAVIKDGDKLRINGDLYSFASLPDGATIPAGTIPCAWIAGPVERIDGEIHLTLVLPHGEDPEEWQSAPDPLYDPPDGDLDIPTNTRIERVEEETAAGKTIRLTTYRWHHAPETNETFIPAPAEQPAAGYIAENRDELTIRAVFKPRDISDFPQEFAAMIGRAADWTYAGLADDGPFKGQHVYLLSPAPGDADGMDGALVPVEDLVTIFGNRGRSNVGA